MQKCNQFNEISVKVWSKEKQRLDGSDILFFKVKFSFQSWYLGKENYNILMQASNVYICSSYSSLTTLTFVLCKKYIPHNYVGVHMDHLSLWSLHAQIDQQ